MTDVAVVGAGIVGLACAHEIAARGADVVVLEGTGVGAGASRGNTGLGRPQPLDAPRLARHARDGAAGGAQAARRARDPALARDGLGPLAVAIRRNCRPEAFRRGVLALVELNRLTLSTLDRWERGGHPVRESRDRDARGGARPPRPRLVLEPHEELRRAGFEGTLSALDAAQAHELEPALSDAIGCALHSQVDRHVQPESLLNGLAAHIRERGVRIREDAQVVALTRSGAGGRSRCAAAIASRRPRLSSPPGGQRHAARAPGRAARADRSEGLLGRRTGRGPRAAHRAVSQRAETGDQPVRGRVRIAGVSSCPARDTSVSLERIAHLLADARPYLRSWRPAAEAPIPAGWAGLRPATPTGCRCSARSTACPGSSSRAATACSA